jgi:hypothetical protein
MDRQREQRQSGQGGGRNLRPSQGGRGRNQGGAFGPGGFCICVKCGTKEPHQVGSKCTTLSCPKCGHRMVREELVRDNLSSDE